MISHHKTANETFSAEVKLHLYVDGKLIELGQLGPGFAILRNAQDIDCSQGEIELVIDEKVTRWPVRFTNPITSASRRFTFESV